MKKIVQHYQGREEKVGSTTIYRTIPNPEIQSVGSIIFLDHFPESPQEPKESSPPDGSFAHPHRGIATFSYLLEGELHHFDSRGNQGIIDKGGIQWMNSGNGIVHDEHPSADFQKEGGNMHGFQLWINLPPAIKAKDPEYMHLKGDQVPEYPFTNSSSKLRVLLGEFGELLSPIPLHTKHFIYHLVLGAGDKIELESTTDFEYAAHVAKGEVVISGENVDAKEMIVFEQNNEPLVFENSSDTTVDIIVFDGEPFEEKIVPYGPFVMNSLAEIQEAYRDFEAGKYGTINYN